MTIATNFVTILLNYTFVFEIKNYLKWNFEMKHEEWSGVRDLAEHTLSNQNLLVYPLLK